MSSRNNKLFLTATAVAFTFVAGFVLFGNVGAAPEQTRTAQSSLAKPPLETLRTR